MKLSGREAAGVFRKPDPTGTGYLIYGEDVMRVALRRQEVIAALIGPEGEGEMRLTRIAAADLRKDAAGLNDAIKAQGFFPGPRVVLVEDATDGLAETIGHGLTDWRAGDAQIIITAGALTAKSALRKLFEGHRTAHAIGLYDEPPSDSEIDGLLADAGLARVSRDARGTIGAMARVLSPGDFRQTVEKLGLYMFGSTAELTPDDVAACAPQSSEAEVDDLVAIVADGRTADIAPILRRLYAQGVSPVTLSIMALRHFRALHTVVSDPSGPASGIGRLRPPVFGPRRDAVIRQVGNWGRDRLEKGLVVLIDTDLQLRSTSKAPPQAVVERALIRLAMMARSK
jgi:DNA polymerase III subunit delta